MKSIYSSYSGENYTKANKEAGEAANKYNKYKYVAEKELEKRNKLRQALMQTLGLGESLYARYEKNKEIADYADTKEYETEWSFMGKLFGNKPKFKKDGKDVDFKDVNAAKQYDSIMSIGKAYESSLGKKDAVLGFSDEYKDIFGEDDEGLL